ncbi:ArsR/SmtB family transcription factor [Caldisalinibacter kiritimatiensis]|uniref:Arsenical resistance operon repressor n=1 Tax=Caldisalinibacter kiritimatiensis TaxID=1304284 RepID=R1CSK9_9FIRM|nr:metalloregulator ArsR/SmtB family transcription factor [Caldisalinibacter kiritimatiensis]EOC99693.1 Arsenical resistance operon repressor [Caldisalinibacter kiritimatiensis]
MKEKVEIFKALADVNRLMILDMLSCGEMCACEIIEGLELTQPTISHHMKILQKAGLVKGRKEGKWMKYSINNDNIDELCNYIKYLTSDKEDCICKKVSTSCKLK